MDIIKDYINDIYIINNKSIIFYEINKTNINIINKNNTYDYIYILWTDIIDINNYLEYITNKGVQHLCSNYNISDLLKKKLIKHELFIYNNYDIICYKYNYDLIKKPKIALLISGYTRTFYRTYKNLLEFIERNNQYIFELYLLVHSGENEIGKYKGKNNEFIKNIKLFSNFNVKLLIIKKNYNDEDNKFMNGFGQFYFLTQLYNNYLEYIKKNNISYNLIMRSRYDIKLGNYIIKNQEYYNSQIIVPKGYFHGFNINITTRVVPNWKDPYKKIREFIDANYIINDKMAISIPKLMDIYLTHGQRHKEISKFLKENYKIGSTEGYLAYDLKKTNIYFTFDGRLGCSIVRDNNYNI